MADGLLDALKARKLAVFRTALKANPKAGLRPKIILEASGMAWLDALELLHKLGADFNVVWRNYRPLHALMQSDPHENHGRPGAERIQCLRWLLDHGADPELRGAWPAARALIIAAFVGEPEYVQCLLKAGARVDGFTGAALGDLKAVEEALARNPSFALERDGDGLTALQSAAGSRLPGAPVLEAARRLIHAGADVRALTRSWGHDVNAAYFAARANDGGMFALMLDSGADPTDALSHALWGSHYELAELALTRGADIDRATANGKPLLNDLIRWGQIPQTMWALAHRASPDVPDTERGWTATHQAASRGNARMMKAVLDAGGDFRRRDHEGRTPIGVARRSGREKLVTMMMAREKAAVSGANE